MPAISADAIIQEKVATINTDLDAVAEERHDPMTHLQSSYNAVGWNGALTGNFKHVLGITGDFSGVYKSHRTSSSVYTYTVGPVLTARLPIVQPFVQ